MACSDKSNFLTLESAPKRKPQSTDVFDFRGHARGLREYAVKAAKNAESCEEQLRKAARKKGHAAMSRSLTLQDVTKMSEPWMRRPFDVGNRLIQLACKLRRLADEIEIQVISAPRIEVVQYTPWRIRCELLEEQVEEVIAIAKRFRV